MSNAKVERRKQEKYNRKKNELKRKIKAVIVGTVVTLIVAAIGILIGRQIWNDYFKYDSIAKINVQEMYSALSNVENANVADEQSTKEVTEETTDTNNSEGFRSTLAVKE